MRLLYAGRYSAPSLGLDVDPKLGNDGEFSAGVVSWTITKVAAGLGQQAALQLGVSYEQTMAPIWIDVIVKPSTD